MTFSPLYHKTRIAPTPSGYLHLGNVFSFAIAASLAKKTGAKLFLRIDDLDQPRVRKEYVQDIFDTLHFLQIGWDEGPRNFQEYETVFAQPLRMSLYRSALQQLQDGGHVFACTCSRTQVLQKSPDGTYPGTCSGKDISLDKPGVCWRLHTSTTKELRVKNLSGWGTTTYLPSSMQSFVVRKKDGFPAYQLTSLIDDVYFGIDLIVRGSDLWPSTLAQLYLARILEQKNFLETAFHHHLLLTDAGGKKLSKSDGAQSILHLRQQGVPAAAILQMIAKKKAAAALNFL